MKCPRCRSEVGAAAAYCGACGENLSGARGDEAALRPPETAAGEVERVIFTARPTLIFVAVGYSVAFFFSLLTMIGLARLGVGAGVSLIYALILVVLPALYHFRRNSQLYTLTDSRVEIDRGLLVRTTRHVPLRNIQDVTISAGIFKRMIGIGDLIIVNAGEYGGSIVLRNIHGPRHYAEMLLRELRHRQ